MRQPKNPTAETSVLSDHDLVALVCNRSENPEATTREILAQSWAYNVLRYGQEEGYKRWRSWTERLAAVHVQGHWKGLKK